MIFLYLLYNIFSAITKAGKTCLSLSKKSLRIKFFKYESFVQTFSKVCGVEGQSHSSPSADGEIPCLSGVFTRGELTKQPSGLFFKRGRFTRESVPLLWSYSNLSADLIGTKIQIEVFLKSEKPDFLSQASI